MYQKDNRKKIVFLGTPEVAASVLNILVQKSSHLAKVILVVSQPPARSSRSQKEILSPVHLAALAQGIPVFTPQTAKEPQFLSDLTALEPDLCVTVAYGNYLPTSFLKIPKCGTVNIHPSLLPLYRGAAPVQRCLERGDKVTGVTLLYTVKEMDAGPIIASQKYEVDDKIKAPELLNTLFHMGAEMLIKNLKNIFNKEVKTTQQEHHLATYAHKISNEESFLNFDLPAVTLHNKIRAFAGWPATKVCLVWDDTKVECKIILTEISPNLKNLKPWEVFLEKNSIDIGCGDKNILQVKEIQPAGKRILSARDFQNGIKSKIIKVLKL